MPDNITTGKLMELIEEEFRKGFRAGETHAAATEVGLRHGLGPESARHGKNTADLCIDL